MPGAALYAPIAAAAGVGAVIAIKNSVPSAKRWVWTEVYNCTFYRVIFNGTCMDIIDQYAILSFLHEEAAKKKLVHTQRYDLKRFRPDQAHTITLEIPTRPFDFVYKDGSRYGLRVHARPLFSPSLTILGVEFWTEAVMFESTRYKKHRGIITMVNNTIAAFNAAHMSPPPAPPPPPSNDDGDDDDEAPLIP